MFLGIKEDIDHYLNEWALDNGAIFVIGPRHEPFRKKRRLDGEIFLLRHEMDLIAVDGRRPRKTPPYQQIRVNLADPASLDTILAFIGEFDENDSDR